MKKDLLFDFTVDKTTKTVIINREFAAELPLVWDAFTKPEILDQWCAPEPWIAITKFMNFEVGGQRLYSMTGIDGEAYWTIQKFYSISPKTNFKLYNAFSDMDGNPEVAGSYWDYTFSEQNGITKVNITIVNESLERMEQIIEGFEVAFTLLLKNLENLLAALSKK